MSTGNLVLTPFGLRFRRRLLPCSIGRGGVTPKKREGDGATPAGVHQITGLLFRPDRIMRPTRWACPIRPGDLWSDDVADPDYNTMVKAPHGYSHEALRRSDPLYDLIILTDWNSLSTLPGRGSAIFLHQWRRPGCPTEGCIALSRRNLTYIAHHAIPGTKLVVPPAVS